MAHGQQRACRISASPGDLVTWHDRHIGPLRGGATDVALAEQIRDIWGARDDRYSELRTRATESGRGLPVVDPGRVEMSRIGG